MNKINATGKQTFVVRFKLSYLFEDHRRILWHWQIGFARCWFFATRRQHIHIFACIVITLQRIAFDQAGRFVHRNASGALLGQAIAFATMHYELENHVINTHINHKTTNSPIIVKIRTCCTCFARRRRTNQSENDDSSCSSIGATAYIRLPRRWLENDCHT